MRELIFTILFTFATVGVAQQQCLELFQIKRIKWTPELFEASLSLLTNNQLPINAWSMNNLSTPDHNFYLAQLHPKMTAQKLYFAGLRLFGSWEQSLSQAKIDSRTVRKNTPELTDAQLLQILQELMNTSWDISAQKMRSNDPLISDFLRKHLGNSTTPKSFYNKTVARFGPWNRFLLSKGYSPQSPIRITWTKELIIKLIQKMNALGLQPNFGNIFLDRSGEIRLFLSIELKTDVKPQRLTEAARYHFGSWDQLLFEAKLDVDEIRKRGFARLEHLGPEALNERRERASREEAILKTSTWQYKGADHPEREVVDTSIDLERSTDQARLATDLNTIEKNMEGFKRKILQSLLDYFSTGASDLSDFPLFFKENFPNENLDPQTFETVLDELRAHLKKYRD